LAILYRQAHSHLKHLIHHLEFPPADEAPLSQPLDLPDPWEGPKTFAEDFYAGGDFREGDLDASNYSPSNLTPLREVMVESMSPRRGHPTANGHGMILGNEEDDDSLPDSSPLKPFIVEQATVGTDHSILDDLYDELELEEAQEEYNGRCLNGLS
jgi:hypothetical protein